MPILTLIAHKGKLNRRTFATALVVSLLLATPHLQARKQQSLIDSSGKDQWQHVTVTIIARGAHLASSLGNSDYYLVLMSGSSKHEPVPVRLVHNYAGFERALSDNAIKAHPKFHLYVSDAPYCAMDAQAFVTTNIFDADAVAKVRGYLPCMVVQQ